MSYDAFLSYSHSADNELAPALQNALHKFAKPWYALRAVRIFRDHTNLALEPDLTKAITNALDTSQYFILMASKQAAASDWVDKEVSHWLKHNKIADTPPSSRILIVLSDGELKWSDTTSDFDWSITNALPPSLAGKFSKEPLWADLRWVKEQDQLSSKDPRFQSEIARLSARLQNKSLDEISGNEVREQKRKVRVIRNGIAAITIALASAVTGTFFGFSGLNEAEKGIASAVKASDVLVKEFAVAFEDYRTVDTHQTKKILNQGTEILGALTQQDKSASTRLLAGSAYVSLADKYYRLGKNCEALGHSTKTLQLLQTGSKSSLRDRAWTAGRTLVSHLGLLDKKETQINKADALPAQLEAYWTIGNSAWNLEGNAAALPIFEQAVAISKEVDEKKRSLQALRFLALNHRQIASIYRARLGREKNADKLARQHLMETEKLRRIIFLKRKTDLRSVHDLADTNLHWAYLEFAGQRYDQAIKRLIKARDILSPVIQKAPKNRLWAYKLAAILEEHGDALTKKNRYHDALISLQESETIQKRLAKDDTSDQRRSRDMATILWKKAKAHLRLTDSENLSKATIAAQKSLMTWDTLLSIDPENGDWRSKRNRVFLTIADLNVLQGKPDEAANIYRSTLNEAKQLQACRKSPNRYLREDITKSIKGLKKLGQLNGEAEFETASKIPSCRSHNSHAASNNKKPCKFLRRLTKNLKITEF